MSVKVKLCSMIRQSANWQEIVEVETGSAMNCINNLEAQFPEVRKWIYDKHGQMWPRLQLFVNDEIIFEEEMNTALKDDDELFVLLNIGGG